MSKQEYNNQELNAYLLGSLAAPETERFDELSFTDDEFADALKSAENDLVDAYVHGELNGATLEKFKSYYLASPVRREKAAFAKSFQTFAEQSIIKKSGSSAFEESKSKKFFAGFFSAANLFTNRNLLLQWGFAAAALVFAFLGGWWIFNNSLGQPEKQTATRDTPAPTNQEMPKPFEKERLANSNAEREIAAANNENDSARQNSEKEQTKKQTVAVPTGTPKPPPSIQRPIIATLILTPSLRGNSRIETLSVSKDTSGIVVRLQLEADDYKAYQAVLVNQSDNKNVWRSGVLKTKGKGANKLLNVELPAALLKSRVYSLQLSGITADGAIEIISDYPFRVVR